MMTKEWVDDETMSVTMNFMASVDYLLLVIESPLFAIRFSQKTRLPCLKWQTASGLDKNSYRNESDAINSNHRCRKEWNPR